MLKQYLTKVIAVAVVAAGAIFVAGCGEEDDSTAPAPEEQEDENIDESAADDAGANTGQEGEGDPGDEGS